MPSTILLVEDDAGHARLTQEAFKEGRLDIAIHTVTNGEAAMAFLRHEAPYHEAPTPDLVLLDLKLPRKDGREVLTELRADAKFNALPVIIFSTSEAEQDVYEAYRLHANCYIAKPMDLDEYLRVIDAIQRFWLKRASA